MLKPPTRSSTSTSAPPMPRLDARRGRHDLRQPAHDGERAGSFRHPAPAVGLNDPREKYSACEGKIGSYAPAVTIADR